MGDVLTLRREKRRRNLTFGCPEMQEKILEAKFDFT